MEKNKYLQICLSIMENEKKMVFRDLVIFPLLEIIGKKKILIIMKNEKKKKFGSGVWKLATA